MQKLKQQQFSKLSSIAFAFYLAFSLYACSEQTSTKPLAKSVDNQLILNAYARKQSHVWVTGSGRVKKLLPDDNKGSRHQRFLVHITRSMTLLFAHNIDLAPRINSLQVGDEVQFKGKYIYNAKGGVVHWTHHQPEAVTNHGMNYPSGWIKHHGHQYQ